MRLQVCRMVYEDAVGIGPEDVVSFKEAEKMLGMKMWSVSQLVDDGELTMLVDAAVRSAGSGAHPWAGFAVGRDHVPCGAVECCTEGIRCAGRTGLDNLTTITHHNHPCEVMTNHPAEG